eukprot:502367_1
MSFSSYKKSFGTEQITQQVRVEWDKQVQIHTNPLLPDDVDEYGNLPSLRCGWKSCGKTFNSKQELLNHVKLYMGRIYVDRFHTNCKNILENNPDVTLSEFEEKVRHSYPETYVNLIRHEDIKAYFDQFQMIFKKHQIQKDVIHQPIAQKETVEILFDFRIQSMKKLMEDNTIPQQFIQ